MVDQKYRIGVDIGGTFTDATLINENTGEIKVAKTPSTPQDPSLGFMAVVHDILESNKVDPANITFLVHATTVATNAIIEGKMARTGFITTDGFSDMLEIGRQTRPSLYDLQFEKLPPLVPRYLCCGVTERLDSSGKILLPLDVDEARRIAQKLRSEKVESIAICLLHAYLNPTHEQQIAQVIKETFPDVHLSLSSEVAPEFREYSRASTTVINAGIRPVVARYLGRIETQLRRENLTAELLLMQSGGGVYTFAEAINKPVFMVESGPAAGVVSAAYLGETLNKKDVISFDMGGTTAKVGLIQNGAPKVTKDYEVGTQAGSGFGSQRGAGYPIRTPVIDLVEIGAGGGSIAWIDSGGILRVGPRSAGAFPGPVCYKKGGYEPTITDANIVLGRIQEDFFLGGRMKLDKKAAYDAIQDRCARHLGLDVVETAYGIIEIANAAMVHAIRLVSVQRGYDPRDSALVAFGGAGPIHANRLAEETGMPVVIVPMSPGTISALGLLVSDLKHEMSATWIERIDRIDFPSLEKAFQRLLHEGTQALDREGVAEIERDFQRQVDIRYVGQSHELTVFFPDHVLTPENIGKILEEFYLEHDRAYGFSTKGEPVEIVNLRVTAVGRVAKPSLRNLVGAKRKLESVQLSERSVYFFESNGYVTCPFYDRYKLVPGDCLIGPAIVIELDATTVIHPGYQSVVDDKGNLILSAVV